MNPVDDGGTRRSSTHDDDDPRWAGFEKKTLWDWLQLLVVPLMLVLVGVWFAWQQDARQDAIEARRAESERTVEDQRAQDTALQAYLDQMGALMIGDEPLLESEEGSAVRTLARARTATVVQRLDAARNQSVMVFLGEAGMLWEGTRQLESAKEFQTFSLLRGNDLREAALSGVLMHLADLSDAYMPDADLSDAGLDSADLSGADLSGADLSGAVLSAADLSGADLSAADLSGADLSAALLDGAVLRGADLTDAEGVTEEYLEAEAKTLEGATMPDGSKHP